MQEQASISSTALLFVFRVVFAQLFG